MARSSYRWQDYYDPRDAVERVNSRLAGGFGFERPGILGLSKMHLRGTVAMTIMQHLLGAHPRRVAGPPAESGQPRLTGAPYRSPEKLRPRRPHRRTGPP